MIIIFTTIFFILGLIIGSFLNVVIARFNSSKSLGGRSACMSCQSTLKWYDLIPILSFVTLGGRCRTCKTRISFMYPAVEFITGIIFAALFLKFQSILFANTIAFSFIFAYYAIAFSILLVIAVYDIRHKIIPDKLSFTLGIFAFFGLFFFNASSSVNSFGFYFHIPTISQLLSGIFLALPFALFWLVSSGRWMGLGDAKLAISLGWLLGLSRALSGVVLSFWIGAIVGISLIIFSRKYGIKSQIPFAPYLALGAFLAFILGLSLFPLF